jgi:hypothetical protein
MKGGRAEHPCGDGLVDPSGRPRSHTHVNVHSLNQGSRSSTHLLEAVERRRVGHLVEEGRPCRGALGLVSQRGEASVQLGLSWGGDGWDRSDEWVDSVPSP